MAQRVLENRIRKEVRPMEAQTALEAAGSEGRQQEEKGS